MYAHSLPKCTYIQAWFKTYIFWISNMFALYNVCQKYLSNLTKTKLTHTKKYIIWNYKLTKNNNSYQLRTFYCPTLCFSYYTLTSDLLRLFKDPKARTSMSSLLFQITATSNWKQLKKALSWNYFHFCDSLTHIC